MEAFNDLQRHWAKRFPHSKLSLIWEEDLRTLLSTHRQRVAQLREELEQEEFLVQYFERYLSDAERVKRSSSRDNTGDRKAGSENGDSSRNSNGVVGTSNGLPEAAAAALTSSTCEKAASLKREKDSNSAEGLAASVNGTTDEHGKPYVTVIAVSGFTRSASSERSSAAAASTGPTATTQAAVAETQEVRRRRKPPTPPPKRAKWPPPSAVSQLAQNDAVVASDSAEPVATVASPSNDGPSQSEPAVAKAQNDATPAFSTFRPASTQLTSSRPHGYPQPQRAAPPPPTAPVIETTDDQDGYDVIYDTVALDDEACSSKEEEDQGSSPEPDYVEFGKLETTRPRAARSDDTGSAPSPVVPSPATYENMALLVKASESMDSEEDDAASMLRSMSSDAELDQDAGTATTGSDHSGSGGRSADLHRCKTEEQLDVDSGEFGDPSARRPDLFQQAIRDRCLLAADVDGS
ncbi:hypothetical protein HPB52_012824 [Rhipicephalus sanguineus]|uniref:Uncharacterized protein n=1 Tax=Rhipicephalus sanguineus TaxID=34632 RepID=A0A9D4SX85_RHISA|nr:hypothetical protein HPB52_012824 [Rhipicephalus sanguineus]